MNQQLYNIIVYLKDFNLKLNEMEIKRKEENKLKGRGKKTMHEKLIMCENKKKNFVLERFAVFLHGMN